MNPRLHLYCYIHNGFGSKFCVCSRVRHKALEGRKKHQSKRCEYNNKDEYNNLKDKNYHAEFPEFKQIKT